MAGPLSKFLPGGIGQPIKWYGKALITQVTKESRDKLLRVGYNINRTMKQGCPVDTGRARGSCSVNWTNSGMARGEVESPAKPEDGIGQPGGGEKEFVVVIGSNVEYVPELEAGHSKQAPNGFMTIAFEAHKGELR